MTLSINVTDGERQREEEEGSSEMGKRGGMHSERQMGRQKSQSGRERASKSAMWGRAGRQVEEVAKSLGGGVAGRKAWAVAAGTHLGLIDEQRYVGKGVQGHVDRQLHGTRVADAAPGGRP